ncbi:MAG: hypothetical protein ACI4TB_04220, partial [Lachnospiraceae bacterium]
LSGVEEWKAAPGKEEGCVDMVLTVAEGADVREAAFYALADKKLPILSMTHTEKSLEDIFLTLTEEEPAQTPGGTSEEVPTQVSDNEKDAETGKAGEEPAEEKSAAEEELNDDSNL